MNMQEIKKMVLEKAGFYDVTDEDIEHYEACDYLTIHDARNGDTVVWYADEKNSVAYDVDQKRYMTEKEIDDQLL